MPKTIQQVIEKDEFLAVGLMSGTSMDGIDAALVRMPGGDDLSGLELVEFQTVPYPDELRDSLRDVAFGEQCTAEDIAMMHTSVATAFAHAFHTVCRERGPDDVDFVGSHGQTIAHVPPAGDGVTPFAGTLQLGPPGMIAALTGVTTVGDFRSADIALGGQGAPLAPYADFLLRKSRTSDRAILNIGGIANLTYLPKNCGPSEVIAFDTGPGNMILDELWRVLFPKEDGYEKLGQHVASGNPSQALVSTFLSMEYFDREPPKSAGHREFGGRFAWEFLSKAESEDLKREDVLASAVSLTTRSIHSAIDRFVRPKGDIDELFVTGGGSRNITMFEELVAWLAPTRVAPIDELGIPADAKEAVDFAVLARETLLARHNVINGVTGASSPAVLGTIALGR
jgi:anhydro-N-acetylmuramic acid kinase